MRYRLLTTCSLAISLELLGRSFRILFMHRFGAAVSRLAGAVIEIGSDLRISPYLSDTSQPTLGLPLRRDITANREDWDNIVWRDSGQLVPQAILRHYVKLVSYVFHLC